MVKLPHLLYLPQSAGKRKGRSPDRPFLNLEVGKVRSLDGPQVMHKASASPTFLPSNPLTFCYFATSCQPVAGVYLIQGPLRVFTLA
jgi:hypothetical protein